MVLCRKPHSWFRTWEKEERKNRGRVRFREGIATAKEPEGKSLFLSFLVSCSGNSNPNSLQIKWLFYSCSVCEFSLLPDCSRVSEAAATYFQYAILLNDYPIQKNKMTHRAFGFFESIIITLVTTFVWIFFSFFNYP